MFRELLSIIKDLVCRVLKSRLFPVTILFSVMFSVLIIRLFTLQIIESEEHQNDYVQMSLSELSTEAVRGNIYDRNGVLLAYDQMVYSVTLKDIGYYETNAQKNQMILELVHLMDECGEVVVASLPLAVSVDSNSKYEYTTTSATRIKQFLRDIYGCTLNELDDESGKYPSDISADEAVEILRKKYYFSKWLSEDSDNPVIISDYDALRVINLRYALSQNVYKKYLSIKVAANIKATTMATVKENAREFKGVDVEEDYVRVYPDGDYFAQIIGYTGVGSTDEIMELLNANSKYEYGDTIGKSGMESLMEMQLSGTKGSKTVYLDSTGKILEVLSENEAVIGNDVYLTIDHDLQIACYKLLEQEMARIILTYLVNEDVDKDVLATEGIKISVKDVYFQLFNNNVLSIKSLYREDADWWEKQIASSIDEVKKETLKWVESILSDKNKPLNELSERELTYMDYVFNYLTSSSAIFAEDKIDKNSEKYKAVKNHTGSIAAFIYDEIYNGKSIKMQTLTEDSSYLDSEEIFILLKKKLLELLESDTGIAKLLIENLIKDNELPPYLICLSLYSQGILEKNGEMMEKLVGADNDVCYSFIVECIGNMKLTPDKLALDPCNGSVVVTDPNSGEVLALVSYPCYDNNMFSGSVDSVYYNKLLNDQSNPLFNYATQARSAPGSTYKMLSSIAALETGIMKRDTEVDCLGIFDLVQPSAKCWIFTEEGHGHGNQNVVQALANSCNYYFYNIGYLLSMEEDGTYNESKGIEKLDYYSRLLGLGEKSGIELNEYSPQISTEYPIASAIGQSTNNYTAVQLARYVTTIASKGNLYELTLLNKVSSGDNIVDECKNEYTHVDEISESTWASIWDGMYEVTHSGTVKNYFNGSGFDVSGKTGSAQEDLYRPNHALFVSFGPSDNPEITVTCTIRHGYSSGYTADLANDIYEYYFGLTTLDSIKENTINQDNSSVVGD